MSELYDYCQRRGIAAERRGKLIVATSEDELPALEELEQRGQENRVPGLTRIGPDEIRELEPHASGLAALHSPMTGVVDFGRVATSFAEDLGEFGGTVSVGCGVAAIADAADGGGTVIDHAQGRVRAGAVVVCAGAWADRLAVAAGAPKDPRIVPFRGAYLRLRRERAHLVRGNIYAVPDPELPFLAPHLTRTIDGDVLLGPTALIVAARDAYRPTRVIGRDLRETFTWPGTWRLAGRHWRAGLTEIRHASSKRAFVAVAKRLVPELKRADFVPGLAGIRAQALDRDGLLVDDFVVSKTERALFVRNAPSPAATSSLPLARLIADEVEPILGGGNGSEG